ncbi:MAG: succinylglutamate desuccinylase/aspartoacylase family protein [Alphaproteobacteria bacterium]|nr:succinylglutamate desuccinylase/aspartoacylase family protein [Alphaproteobacteria bacterium]
MSDDIIESHIYASLNPGPRLLILGAVHGNEKCGTHAIRRVIQEIGDGKVAIEKGSVTFIPICNPRAYAADTRFIDRNLNRYLLPQENPDSYEARIGNILCPHLAACDVLLDLHSYHSGGKPFVFISQNNPTEYAYASCLGGAALLTGWQSAYAASGRDTAPADPNESVGTTEYVRLFGGYGVTMECGQHKDPASNEAAYGAIHRALAHLGLARLPVPEIEKTPLIEVKKVFYREKGGQFTKTWEHLDPVKKGDIIAHDDNGNPSIIPDDGFLILPHVDTVDGTEWFYWGQKK